MELTLMVIGHESGSRFVDKRPRVLFRVLEADGLFECFRIRVDSIANYPMNGVYQVDLGEVQFADPTA